MTTPLRRSAALAALGAILALALISAPEAATTATAAPKGDGSGGRAVAHRSGARPAPASATRNAPSAELFRIGMNASEPTLGLTKNGDIFYTAFQTNTRIEIVRSRDEGKSWKVVSPSFAGVRNAQLVSFDPYLFVDPRTNRVFTIDLTVACAYLSYTDDQGKSWTTNPLACGRPVNDHQTLFGGPPVHSPTVGYKDIMYYCWNDVGSSSCGKSLDGGITFHPTGSPAFPGIDPDAGNQSDNFCGGLHGHGHVGYDGTVYLPKGHCGQPYVSISRDEGTTWTRVQVAKNGIEGHEAGIATDKKNNVYYTWVGPDRRPYLAVSKNRGKTWGKPMMIGPPGIKEANLPGIDVGAPGKVAVVYMGSENSPFKPVRKEDGEECTATNSCPAEDDYDKTTWNGYMVISANALDKDPVFYTGTVNDKKDPLVRQNCGPGRCQAVYDFIDVVVGPRGDAWAAFVDGCISICATPAGASSMGSDGIVGHLRGGPKLR